MTVQLLSIALGLSLAASVGFRVFIPLLALSAASYFGLWDLNENWEWLGSISALIVFSVATIVEILAYFIPFVDNLLDTIAVPLATVAGTIIVVSTMADVDPVFKWGLAIIAGGGTAAAIKGSMGTSRVSSSLSTAGLANPLISGLETITAIILSILSIFLPLIAFGLVLLIIYVLYRLYRKITPRSP